MIKLTLFILTLHQRYSFCVFDWLVMLIAIPFAFCIYRMTNTYTCFASEERKKWEGSFFFSSSFPVHQMYWKIRIWNLLASLVFITLFLTICQSLKVTFIRVYTRQTIRHFYRIPKSKWMRFKNTVFCLYHHEYFSWYKSTKLAIFEASLKKKIDTYSWLKE
jgi:hypothetical protein